MLAVSLPLYVCATASIPIAVVLMSKGIPAGAVFVFLMAGPATNASSIAVIKNILGTRTLYQYLTLISLTAIVFGAILDSFFNIILPGMDNITHVHGDDGLYSIFLTIIFLLILANSYRYSIKGSNQGDTEVKDSIDQSVDNKTSFEVGGMTCSHCKESVENAVKSCSGVQSVSVDLLTGLVQVGGSGFDDRAIQDKIKSIGFELK
jgi:copper chaperone CopZ